MATERQIKKNFLPLNMVVLEMWSTNKPSCFMGWIIGYTVRSMLFESERHRMELFAKKQGQIGHNGALPKMITVNYGFKGAPQGSRLISNFPFSMGTMMSPMN